MGEQAGGRRRQEAPRAVVVALALGLVGVSWWLRRDGLGPPALYIDDAWVALGSLKERWFAVPTRGLTAPGFSVLLRPFLHVGGTGSSTAAQLPAFVVGCITPAVVLLVLRERGVRLSIAAAAGLLLAFSPVHIRNSYAVKQYAFDTLLVVLILWLAWCLLEDGYSRRRWNQLLVLTCASVAFSFQTAVPAAVAVGLVLLRVVRDADRRWILATAAATAGFCAVVFGAIVVPLMSEQLQGFWDETYIDVGNGAMEAFRSLRTAMSNVLIGLVYEQWRVLAVALLAAAAVLVLRRPWLAALFMGPLVLAVVLAATERAPLGGGRTDMVYYPLVLLAVAAAAELGVAAAPPRWQVGAEVGVVTAVLASAVAAPPALPYVSDDVVALAEVLDEQLRPGDTLVLLPAGNYLYGYYSDRLVEIVDEPRSMTGYGIEIDGIEVVDMPDPLEGADPADAVREAAAGADRIWMFGLLWTGIAPASQELERLGFVLVEQQANPSAAIRLWVRDGAGG